jgi:3-methyladenine DNA glycosylase/8-oxoguanine DNA glycosylase
VIEAALKPRGPYRLSLMARRGLWQAPLEHGDALAWQRADGRVVIRAPDAAGVERARFMLALDDDTAEFHRRFACDPLVGRAARTLAGYRPLRRATVAAALLRGLCGQLVESRRARTLERAIVRACGSPVATQDALARLAPAELAARGLAARRAAALIRICRSIDLEALRREPTAVVAARLGRERCIGPWTTGVVALEGLGRYDHGLVGDLELVKLASALRGRWVEPWETAELLAPYGEWQGLACALLLLGWSRALVPGADPDVARRVRSQARRAA